ncbi:MAG: type IV pilus modification PilV family protein [Nitrospiraceae bacterium]
MSHRKSVTNIQSERGFSLLEVMVAMVILAFSMLGMVGMFQWGDYGVRQGSMGTRALEMAQARIEAKRTVPWESLLSDDLDMDGAPDVIMRDDGREQDVMSGDGIFTASVEQDGIRLLWTIHASSTGSFLHAGAAVIHVSASYQVGDSVWRHINIGTLRANPNYIGSR